MNTRLLRLGAALLSTAALTLTAAPSADAHIRTGITCRSSLHGAYWLHGVRSDACDGSYGDGRFVGEINALVDGNPDYTDTGPIQQCQIQLNRVVGRNAYPMRGYNTTGRSYDHGLSCDVFDSWRLPAGTYNVTASYEVGGRWFTTVQGPVVDFTR